MTGSEQPRGRGKPVRSVARWARPRDWPVLQGLLPAAPGPAARGPAGRGHAGRGGHPRGARLRPDRRDAGGHRAVHAAAADGPVRRARAPRGTWSWRRTPRPRPSWPAPWSGWPTPARRSTSGWPGWRPCSPAPCCMLARLARLGFLASFLSRTVLLGFLTGVGIQVAIGQLPDMLGVTASSPHTLVKLGETVAALPQAQGLTVAVSLGVVAVMMAARRITRRIPGALIAVVGAIIASRVADLAAHGVSVLGYVPRGLPAFALPALRAARHARAAGHLGVDLPRHPGPERGHRPRVRGQARRAVRHRHRPGRARGRQHRRRVHRDLRGERQPDQDPDRGRRGRPEPGGLAHHQRAGPRRAARRHRPAQLPAHPGPGRGGVPDRRRAGGHPRHAPGAAGPAAPSSRSP